MRIHERCLLAPPPCGYNVHTIHTLAYTYIRCRYNIISINMDFGVSFAFHLLFLTCFDTCWLMLNFKVLRAGLIYPDTQKRTLSTTIVCCFLCWITSALYLAGHQQDTLGKSAIEGAWVGSLVYAVFNFTTFIVQANWPILPTAMIDTLWGTILFAVSSLFTTLIATVYF